MSLVFYNTKASGTETFFDQILQFTALQTNEHFTEMGRFEIRCRLLPYVVPTPRMIIDSGMRPSQLTDPSLPSHYEMVCSVRAKLLSWSPTLLIGWNSLRFDEQLLRQALYKTLHSPYFTNSAGNSRSDLMRIVQACSIYAADALTLPTDTNGDLVFELDQIASANGFTGWNQNKMPEVEAMIFLSQLLMEKAPHIWSSFMRFSTKAAVADYIMNEPMFCVSDFFFKKPYSFIVTTIGRNEAKSAEWYVYDLSVQPESLLSLSEAELAERLSRSPKPIRRVKSNASPMLFPVEDAPASCKGRGYGLEELGRRALVFKEDSALCNRLVSAFESLKEGYPASSHVEKQIYDCFFKEGDEMLMDKFHVAPWAERCAIVAQFDDPRLRAIGRQLVHCERPELLNRNSCQELDLVCALRVLGQGDDISWTTLPQALKEIGGLVFGATGAKLELVLEHEGYLQDRQKAAINCVQSFNLSNSQGMS
jgi:exodeoxyribonuclease-1